METVADRINRILDAEGVKKRDLARRLKISDSSVSTMCSGKSNPSGQTITMICKEFGIREEWLKYGKGEMYARKEPEPLEELLKCREVPESDLAVVRSVVSAFLELGETSRKEVINPLKRWRLWKGKTGSFWQGWRPLKKKTPKRKRRGRKREPPTYPGTADFHNL